MNKGTALKNWEFRLRKFRNILYSWSSRSLATVQDRVDVVKIFGLSRTYYVASILPIRSRVVKSFEYLIGRFIWKSPFSVLKIVTEELINKLLLSWAKLSQNWGSDENEVWSPSLKI